MPLGEVAVDRLAAAAVPPAPVPVADSSPSRPGVARAAPARGRVGAGRCRSGRARRRRDGGARGRAQRREPRSAARHPREVRRLRAARHRQAARVRRRQPAGARDVRRRGARPRGGPRRPAVRRAAPASCSTACWRRSGSTAPPPISPTSSRGARPATARRRRRRARSACRSSRRQIELADPDVLVCLGGPAAAALLGVKEGIKRTRGSWFTYDTGTREIRAIATLPSGLPVAVAAGEAPRVAGFSEPSRRRSQARVGGPRCAEGTRVLCLIERSSPPATPERVHGPRSRPSRAAAVRLHDHVPHHLPELHDRALGLHRDARHPVAAHRRASTTSGWRGSGPRSSRSRSRWASCRGSCCPTSSAPTGAASRSSPAT